MTRTFKLGSTAISVVGALGVFGAGCLSRPINNLAPVTQTNFTAKVHNEAVDKLDLLFMIDNSASMGDKQALLAAAVPDMITRLVSPNCVDDTGAPIVPAATADPNGNCATGKAEFPPVHDMHIGIVTSSLGGRGGDQCSAAATNPANAALNSHNDDQGHLINRGGVAGDPTVENVPSTDTNSSNFLSWFPTVIANMGLGVVTPLPPAITVAATLVSDFTTLVEGVHEHGCGFEAQNEAWYRFLVQPDPFTSITVSGSPPRATLGGIDTTILQQRHDFLRSDSLLTIIVVTDENEAAADPLAIGGEGWAFDSSQFPNSPTATQTAPQGTIECDQLDPANPLTTGPNDPNCESCAFLKSSDPTFATRCPKDGANGASGYLDPLDDALNNRFYHQGSRFGVTSMYPTARYVRGMQQTTVPDSQHEHDGSGNYRCDPTYQNCTTPQGQMLATVQANCVNPIYAQNLPTTASGPDDPTICALTPGTRTPDLVYYAAIAGVPHELLQATPGATDNLCATGTAPEDCPQKDTLSDADWTLIMGKDPEHYDFSGADFHMVENWDPRLTQGSVLSAEEKGPLNSNVMANASNCPPTATGSVAGQALCDPINGREWNTNIPAQGHEDLQFSCIFDLKPQFNNVGKDCTLPQYKAACDCAAGALNSGSQLCDSATPTLQVYGKAYPSVREMIIAKAMSESMATNQGIVSSLCPIHVTEQTPGDPLYGYRPAVNAIIDRLKNSLSTQCTPQKLNPDSSGIVPCLILVQLGQAVGAGACANPGSACDTSQGLYGPGAKPPNATAPLVTSDILSKFCASQEAGFNGVGTDPDTLPTCALAQLTTAQDPNDFDSTGSCSTSPDPGWCYVTGAAASGCQQAILFTNGQPPHGSTVSLQCIEQAVTVIGVGNDAGSGGD
jgi:hypothetical protein